MDREPKISVIVPVYNVEQYLTRCVESILAQTYRNLEIILVDDGAKDASGSLCEELAARDARISVIHKENGGLSSARNAGIDIATGDYLAFVDSDDWIEPDMYAHMLGLMKRYDARLVCAGRYDVDSRDGSRKKGLCPEREEVITGMELLGRVFTWENCDSAAGDKLYHRSLFQKIRYPLGVVSEDVAMFYKLAELADRVVMCDRPFYNYYHRPGSITMAKLSDKTFHYCRHTAVIYAHIRQHHPEVEPQARYLRVRGLVHAMQSIDLAGPEAWTAYAEIYRSSRAELRSHVGFVLKSPLFTAQEKRTNFVLATGTYRWLRKLYHAVK